MFTAIVHDGARPVRTIEVSKEMVTIGRDESNDLVLADSSVSSRHARIFHLGRGVWLVVDLGTRRTFKNGSPVAGSTLFRTEDVIRVGRWDLRVRSHEQPAEPEAGLVRMIQERPADPEPRLVYSDWLEESGEPLRAEYVRLQLELERADAS